MYADDTVIFANSEAGLQKALDELSEYCKTWKLKVNSSKTKVTIFGKTKYRGQRVFHFEGEPLEIVHNFKYLGIWFNYNGRFNLGIKHLADQGKRAMFSVFSKSCKLDLPVDIQLDLFDKIIIPILTYGCEVWGFENTNILEKLHLSYCKQLLQLKKSTGNMFVYGELGRYPLSVIISTKMISYWHTMATGKETKLNTKLYNILHNLNERNLYTSKWLLSI